MAKGSVWNILIRDIARTKSNKAFCSGSMTLVLIRHMILKGYIVWQFCQCHSDV